jgi:PadR family transcriptional regulator, regulatory protein PadR
MAKQPAPLMQGTLDLIILEMLRGGPTSGFDLTRRIQATSQEVLKVNAGSLYPALYRLQARGLIRSEWVTTVNKRRAKLYSLTTTGEKQLAAERGGWERFAGAMAAILRRPGTA